MPSQRKYTGERGEELAGSYLLSKGYSLLELNWRSGHLEIDLIACRNQVLHIIEVKTRSSRKFGEPWAFVSPGQQKRLFHAAESYLQKHNLAMELSFDIISIVVTGRHPQIEHIQGAFRPHP